MDKRRERSSSHGPLGTDPLRRRPLARYVAGGRRDRASTRQPARSGRKAQPSALNTTEVREWAKAQGIDVKDRGRIPAELVVKFKAATVT